MKKNEGLQATNVRLKNQDLLDNKKKRNTSNLKGQKNDGFDYNKSKTMIDLSQDQKPNNISPEKKIHKK